jgi:peptidoglycan/LPS O-acetylase OafA/YrhL
MQIKPISSTIKYRKDIDGMRAVAVLAVIFFHISHNLLPGGFVGVDVFFVISGFLITKILVKSITQHDFKYSVFYIRRVRRIFPALFVMLLVCSIVALLIFSNENLHYFAKTLRASALQISNIFFQGNQNYFAPGNDTMPLLHTWSLGVEEQYYLVWPTVLLLLFKFRKNISNPFYTLIALSLLSLIYSEYLVLTSQQNMAFYSLLSRFWELGIGGILAFGKLQITSKLWNEVWGFLGALCIVIALVFTNSNYFPGIEALLPCVGSGLLIVSASQHKTLVARFLENPILVFIGLISYSLYLWHWPIIIFYKAYTATVDISLLAGSGIVAVSILIAYLSWRFIENGFRKSHSLQQENLFSWALPRSIKIHFYKPLLAAVGLMLFFTGLSYSLEGNGWNWRLLKPEDPKLYELNRYLSQYSISSEEKNLYVLTVGPNKKNPEVVVYGDSHAQAYGNAIISWAKKKKLSVHMITGDACPPLVGIKTNPEQYQCGSSQQAFWSYLASHPRVRYVFLASRWSIHLYKLYGKNDFLLSDIHAEKRNVLVQQSKRIFRHHLAETVRKIPKHIQIILMGDVPNIESSRVQQVKNYSTLWAYHMIPESYKVYATPINHCEAGTRCKQTISFVRSTLRAVADKYKNVTLFDPTPYLCAQGSCSIEKNGVVLYKNGDHLNSYGSDYIGKYFSF